MTFRLLVAACLWLSTPAGAQRFVMGLGGGNGSWPRETIRSEGNLLMADSGAGVVPSEPGAYFFLQRVMEDGHSEQLEMVGTPGGGVRSEHRVDGTLQHDSGDGFRRGMMRMVDTARLAEHTRLVRLRAQGGMAAVLRHVSAGSHDRRVGDYLELLADPTLSPAELDLVVSGVESMLPDEPSGIRLLQMLGAVAGDLSPASQAVLVRRMVPRLMRAGSDTEAYGLMRDLPRLFTMDDPVVADAFFGGAGTAGGTPERVFLLTAVASSRTAPASVVARALRAGVPLPEPDRVRLLLAVPQVCLRSAQVRAAYGEVTRTVRYEMDRLRVQTYLDRAAVPAWRGLAPPCGRG